MRYKIMPKIKECAKAIKKKISFVMAVAKRFIDELGLVEAINEKVEWNKEHWNISPGGLAKAFIMSTLTDIRVPLTHVSERLKGVDLEYLIGEDAEEHEVNSFNIGRAFDRIAEIDYEGLYASQALSALQIYKIPMTRSHGDTTTISFYGDYDVDQLDLSEEELEELLKIEKGYNKDGRPECNQIVVGQITNEFGVSIVSKVMDGSTSDVEWNKLALDYITKIRESGFDTGIYVADSKLVTNELVTRMNDPENKILFVSRCPANFENKLEKRMIEQAYENENWDVLGQYGKGQNASNYKGISFIENICGAPTKLLVLESSALAANTGSILDKELKKFNSLVKEIEKKSFACQADAEKEYAKFVKLKEKSLSLFDYSANIVKCVNEKWPRGRKGINTCPVITETYQIRITNISVLEEACYRYLRDESCIVLISNATEDVTDRELLGIYKGQIVVENSFRQLKNPQLASVIYLKNPKRIQVLTMLLNFSLLIRALIQYRLRDGLKKRQEEHPDEVLRVGWAGRPLVNPTFKLFYEHAINCYFERDAPGEYSFTWPDEKTKKRVSTLLSLLSLTIDTLLL